MNLISIADLSGEDILRLIQSAEAFRARRGRHGQPLEGKSLAMIFEKPSTRTRVSLEVAAWELGGHPLYLSANELQLGRGETIADTARVLSRYVHGITARVHSHGTVLQLAEHASVPVINALSDWEHPLQILADLQTMSQNFQALDGLQIGWIGDGNNVCNSLILASAILRMEITVASPPGYGPKAEILEEARALGGSPRVVEEPEEAAGGADVLVTDTWVSMGDEAEEAERLRVFGRYQINSQLMDLAGDGAIALHCLPAHRGQEITDEVMDGPRSRVFDEAENRMHTSKAVMAWLMGEKQNEK
ncbi:ornithine carbamoyltransferase [Methanothrix soehngenii]|jgi:ornithine carbamoyltransferase|uniref:Ornithine carbamoyltransferase n=1 Tax=Methanothrix soehngenii (strain ATCC 5969 / DSM 3671 / JCM 10134 / NBRC 103675 / OCM 69 / GP-6) TaxID=990316 RepID=F4BUW1_METSG|nr:ornithine carbamoyltransferase [Methanothrix soehngenii]AEB68351.1 ornithine carbamoyltransferase [Methanothrix soehngenii GP6]HNQ51688.1 ornithine carbamoyltransferase [Methanothrix soehngenii]HNT45429.1 ornithine carbamoyltransferase [Methanothrix soehngenii]